MCTGNCHMMGAWCSVCGDGTMVGFFLCSVDHASLFNLVNQPTWCTVYS
jgi:hypothetical protein